MIDLKHKIFNIQSEEEFRQIALAVFQFQVVNNPVYARYIELLNIDVNSVDCLEKIPFLPIEFFKSHKVTSSTDEAKAIFTSSGTTGNLTSRHYVPDLEIYEDSFTKGFEAFYGPVNDYCILALLPSYLEREGSSLIYMMEKLIKDSGHPKSGFYLNNHEELIANLDELKSQNQKVLLLGVSFALLELAENHQLDLGDVIVMETGGMKGRRKEITREELHAIFTSRLGVKKIHSEYGMTELLSQGYSKGDSLFKTPAWMKILIRDAYDPFSYEKTGRSGGVNVIDLANLYSCSFIETQDLGKIYADGKFEILGRFDNSDIRGCNLLVSE
ncbi:acyl transferase [Ancylomarina euxinus]|uniref:Acyl transferase n=1 Tax=Ancylomarina euxinus TaxID=2283627 RepID=A0A425Y023_9BACT|nr:acyl transferase [Ancylomarina euxinus]MCZ4695463.1 acyl transferase [Ancylomarina euxinus]MUP15719.1 acyl transferase [Ancylomarina euxinus]RRG20733.1 acyl transferase [Ancylomarina euxinus]